LWLVEAIRLLPRGFSAISQGNKVYLRGVKSSEELGAADSLQSSAHKGGHQAGGQASATPAKRERHNPRWPAPHFFEEAVDRVAWHAKQGHTIVIVSGTLEPLAKIAAQALTAELAARRFAAKIHVCATRLEEADGCWTGRIAGEAVVGEAKACTAKRMAEEMRLDLAQSFAYGDSAYDGWLLATVGHPVAANPSRKLLRIARKRRWPILRWNEEKDSTRRTPRAQRTESGKLAGGCWRAEHSPTFQKTARNAELCP